MKPLLPAGGQSLPRTLVPRLAGALHQARRYPIVLAASFVAILGAIYWLALASDRFVSEAHVVVQRTDLPGGQGPDLLGGLLGNQAPGRADQLLLREHLRSLDMVARLDAALHLRAHYSSPQVDLLSRMWRHDAPIEWLHRHYLARTQVEFDDYTGVLTIQAQAYDAATAQAIAAFLVNEGEQFLNAMGRSLAQAQVAFLQRQVEASHERARQARAAVLAYQDNQGLLAPDRTAESVAAVVARLEEQKSQLQVQRAALLGYLVPGHPQVELLSHQLAALERQIARERARLAAPGGGQLNRTIETFQQLQAQATFAQDLYRAALMALEKGQVEAQRTLKKVSVLQAPRRPEYPLQPHRLYNASVLFVAVALLAGVLQLLAAIVRDHRD